MAFRGGGDFLGRNERNAPVSDSDEEEGEGAKANSRYTFAAKKGEKAQYYATREEEDAKLDAHVQALLQDAQAGPAPQEEEAALDDEMARFRTRLREEIRKGTNAVVNRAMSAVLPTKAPPEVAAAQRLRRLVGKAAGGPVPWNYAGPGGSTLRNAETKVMQIEAAICRPARPSDPVGRLFWTGAARPPWPLHAVPATAVPLVTLCRVLDHHFALACAGILVLSPAPLHRVALLAAWNAEEVGRGLAFILSGASPEALAFAAPDDTVLPLGDMTTAVREAATWHYVGATPVPLVLVQAARGKHAALGGLH